MACLFTFICLSSLFSDCIKRKVSGLDISYFFDYYLTVQPISLLIAKSSNHQALFQCDWTVIPAVRMWLFSLFFLLYGWAHEWTCCRRVARYWRSWQLRKMSASANLTMCRSIMQQSEFNALEWWFCWYVIDYFCFYPLTPYQDNHVCIEIFTLTLKHFS